MSGPHSLVIRDGCWPYFTSSNLTIYDYQYIGITALVKHGKEQWKCNTLVCNSKHEVISRILMLTSPNFQLVRSRLRTSPVLTGRSANITLAMRSRLRAYPARNLCRRRRLESRSTLVGIADAILWRLTVCTTQMAWRTNASNFMRARFLLLLHNRDDFINFVAVPGSCRNFHGKSGQTFL